jgi:butyryl-CoA dehydrogenase
MDFEPTPEQAESVTLAREVGKTFASLPSDPYDFTRIAHERLGERGFFRARSTLALTLAVIELSSVSASLGAILSSGWLFAETLRRWGKPHHAPLAAEAEDGALIGCNALADWQPDRDSAVTARAEGAGYRVTGTTAIITAAPLAERAVLVVPLAGAESVVALLDLGKSGVRRGPSLRGLGLEGSPRGHLELSDVLLDEKSLLVAGVSAARVGRTLLDARRIWTAAIAVGVASRALGAALAHVRLGEGQRPRQATEFALADLATNLEAARHSVLRAAWLREAGEPHTAESAAAKLLATRLATRVAHGALGVCGQTGPADVLFRAYQDARCLEMHDGTDTEQEDELASAMLGEGRE